MDNSDLDFTTQWDEIDREQDRWNYIEAELENALKQVAELEEALNEIMDKCHDLPVADEGFVIWTIASTALNK